MNQPLPEELRELEAMLEGMRPTALCATRTELIASAVDAELSDAAPDQAGLEELERHLEQISPATMRTDVLSRMVKAMDTWYEQVSEEEKVVSFEREDAVCAELSTGQKRSGGMWAAAAAVAFLGAATALMMPYFSGQPSDSDSLVNQLPAGIPDQNVQLSGYVEPRDAWMMPDAVSHKVVNTADRGMVMSRDNVPHRCIRLDGVETIRLEDELGREITIKRPNVRYVLIPVESN